MGITLFLFSGKCRVISKVIQKYNMVNRRREVNIGGKKAHAHNVDIDMYLCCFESGTREIGRVM